MSKRGATLLREIQSVQRTIDELETCGQQQQSSLASVRLKQKLVSRLHHVRGRYDVQIRTAARKAGVRLL